MGPPKRTASSTSQEPEAKRPKPSEIGNRDLSREIERFLDELNMVPLAYQFVPDSHPYKIGPTEEYRGTAVYIPAQVRQLDSLQQICDFLKQTKIALPLYRDMQFLPEFVDNFKRIPPVTPETDRPLKHVNRLESIQRTIVKMGENLFGQISLPSPSAFGKSTGWHDMQSCQTYAINCYRPGDRRPVLPVKVKHLAFYEFHRSMYITPTTAQLEPFREVANHLASVLTDPIKEEATRRTHIHAALEKLFPPSEGYVWSDEKYVDGKGKLDLHCIRRSSGDVPPPLIMVEVKLERGAGGDAFLQLCRMYDVYVASNNHIPLSGAPCFLLACSGVCHPLTLIICTLSSLGPSIEICGGFVEKGTAMHAVVDVDVFCHVYAYPDVTYGHREKLAHALFALHCAVKRLPM